MKCLRVTARGCTAIIAGLVLFAGTRHAMATQPIGVDVSSYQGTINWTDVKNAGYSFAWAKATEGTFYEDAYFAGNENNANSAGIDIGAYHFCHPESDVNESGADAEASYFWNFAGGYQVAGRLVPMCDFEESYSTGTYMSDWINYWCSDVKNYAAANGATCNPVVYTDGSIASDLASPATDWPLDIADPGYTDPQGENPSVSLGPWSDWTFWQYSWTGSVSGISGGVDEDIIDGTATTLAAFLISSSGTSAGPGVTLDWDPGKKNGSPGSGGGGTWNTGTGDWWLSGTGDVDYSASGDYAVFAGSSGAVTLGTSVEADSLNFKTAGYVISGSDTLTLNSPANINVPAGSPTYIECVLAGQGYNLSGGGILVLTSSANASGSGTSAEFISGPNTTLVVESDHDVGNSGVTLNLENGGIYQNNDSTSGDQFLLSTVDDSYDSAIALLTNGGVFDNPNANLTMSDFITGPGSLTTIGTTYTLTLTDTGNNYTGGTIVQSGTLKANAAGTLGSTSGPLTIAGGTLDLNGASHTVGAVTFESGSLQNGTLTGSSYTGTTTANMTVSAVLAGSGALTQNGSGTTILTLSGANTYSGITTIGNAQLQITADDNLGTAPGSALADQITLSGGYLRCSSTFTLNAHRGMTLGSGGGGFYATSGQTVTYGGIITGGGGPMTFGSNFNVGFGTLVLSGASTYTGATTIAAGTVQLNASGVLPSGTALTIESTTNGGTGGTLNLNNNNQTIGSLASGTGIAGTGTTTPTVSLGSGTLTVNGPGSGTFSGTISGSGGLTISGTGTLTLSGTTSTYSGATTVNGTTGYSNAPLLSISTASALGSTSGLTLNNGCLKNNNSSPTLGSGLTITLGAAGGYFDAGWAPSEPITINGKLTGSGALYINLDGSPVVLANTGNNYTGNTVIGAEGPGYYSPGSQAWLQLGAAGVIPNGPGYGNVTINGGAGFLGELDLNGFSQTINGLSGSGTVESSRGSPTLTVGNDNASSAFGGVIENGSGTVALTKVGAGTLSLAGASTYTGATTISAGTLQLAGSVSSSSVTVGNPSFATPAQSAEGYTYNPSGATWTFNSSSGIAANGSPWYGVNSPSGTQAAFIQGSVGAVSQSLSFPSTGNYQVSFEAIGRGGSGGSGSGPQTLTLEIDGNPIAAYTPGNTAWTAYTSPVISLSAGAHTLAFQGTATIDNSTCITAVSVSGLAGSGGSINNTPSISIAAGATFDVSAIASYALSASTALSASGSTSPATINGSTTVNLGSQPITLTYDGSHPALTIAQGTLVLNGNAFTVNGPALTGGVYTLIQQAGGNVSASGNYSVSGTAIPAGDAAFISFNGGSVLLTVLPPNAGPVTIIGSTVQANGTLQLNFTGVPYYTYLIQSTPSLSPPAWTNVGTNTASASGTFSFTDLNNTNYNAIYYRSIIPQN